MPLLGELWNTLGFLMTFLPYTASAAVTLFLLRTWWWPACCGLCSLWGVSTTTSETWRASGAKWCCRWVQLITASAASHLDPCVMCGSKQGTWFFTPSQPVRLYQGNDLWRKHTQKPANNFLFLHFHLKKGSKNEKSWWWSLLSFTPIFKVTGEFEDNDSYFCVFFLHEIRTYKWLKRLFLIKEVQNQRKFSVKIPFFKQLTDMLTDMQYTNRQQ